MTRYKIAIILLSIMLSGALNAKPADNLPWLENLDLGRNDRLQSIRKDIQTTLRVVKGYRDPSELPELRFFRYRLKQGDTFWKVLTRTSLDMDTLVSVNSLGSPDEVKDGTVLYIPNMRGIMLTSGDGQRLIEILRTGRIKEEYVLRANHSESLEKKNLFIPCGRISLLDRSLFLGTAFASPLGRGHMSSRFGMRRDPFGKKYYSFHGGVDFSCDMHSRIKAARRGRVLYSGYEGGYGNLIIIEHERGYQSYYGHLSRMIAKPGDMVEIGQVIGLSGNSGRSTGPHLHFEIRRNNRQINPVAFLR